MTHSSYPFAFIGDIIEHSDVVLSQLSTWLSLFNNSALLTTVFNLFLTMPFGAYLRYYFRVGWKRALLYSFLLSLFFELTQLTGALLRLSRQLPPLRRGRPHHKHDRQHDWFHARRHSPALPAQPRRARPRQLSCAAARVSFTRRLVAFLYDMAVYAVISLVAHLALFSRLGVMSFWGYALMWLVYFTLCPMLLRGSTVGHRLTRLRIVSKGGGKAHWYQYALRHTLLLAVLTLLPYTLNYCVNILAGSGVLGELAAIVAIRNSGRRVFVHAAF